MGIENINPNLAEREYSLNKAMEAIDVVVEKITMKDNEALFKEISEEV